jgi:hypothetical protein
MKKNMADIILVPLTIADREQFIKDNQEAFNYGALEMEIQGEEEQIDRVIMSINAGRYVSVERMDVKTIPVEQENGFRTR